MTDFTKHGSARAQQRAIPTLIIELLIEFGKEECRQGATIYTLDKQSRKKLQRAWGRPIYKRIKDHLNAYVVLPDDGTVITTGWRRKRFKS